MKNIEIEDIREFIYDQSLRMNLEKIIRWANHQINELEKTDHQLLQDLIDRDMEIDMNDYYFGADRD